MSLKNSKENQSGQALVSGIVFLLFALLFSVYFLFMSESYIRNALNIEKARENTLKNSAHVANVINQISLNNQNIIAALAIAENAFVESAEIGLYVGFAQPYWETYGLKQKTSTNTYLPATRAHFFLKEEHLSNSSKETLEKLYSAFRNQSARGLFIAKSLSEKNKNLIAGLPPEISKNFMRSSNSDAFCFALETQKKYYQKPGFHDILILESLYHFYLEKEGCKIKQQGGIFGFLNLSLPLQTSSESDHILSYKDFDLILKNSQYGIWYVVPENSQNFLSSLKFQSENSVQENKKLTIISNFLAKIPYFQELNLNKKALLSGFSKKINSRITHPYFICSKDSKWNGDFLTENDFQNKANCSLSKGQFIKSFFYPKWTPLISSEEYKNESYPLPF